MNRIRIQIGLDRPVLLPCASHREAEARAERLVELFRLAGQDNNPCPVVCSGDRWTIQGLHDLVTVTVEEVHVRAQSAS